MEGPFRGFVELSQAAFDSAKAMVSAIGDEIIRRASPPPPRTWRPDPLVDALHSAAGLDVLRVFMPKTVRVTAERSALDRITFITPTCQCGRMVGIQLRDNVLEDARYEALTDALEDAAAGAPCYCVEGRP